MTVPDKKKQRLLLYRSDLCLMKGMLIQLAAATAAKGTNRLAIGGRRCGDGTESERR